jgi:hypothetical protein
MERLDPQFGNLVFAGLPGIDEEEIDVMRIKEIEIHEYAKQLLEVHGDRAVAEAAQKALAFEMQNNKEEADTWRHIEAALKLMRGPHES